LIERVIAISRQQHFSAVIENIFKVGTMNYKGRPPVRQVQLKDGFYIEVCNKGNNKGVKIWCQNKEAMDEAVTRNAAGKDVLILGEYKSGSPVKK
jgi:hypothetical protein